jgi:hypothetical protein
VGIGVPFHCAVELEINAEPVSVTNVSVEPAMVEEGLIDARVGTGFDSGVGVTGAGEDAPPPQPIRRGI